MTLSIGNNSINLALLKKTETQQPLVNSKPENRTTSENKNVINNKTTFNEVRKNLNLETNHKTSLISFPTPTKITTSLGQKIEALTTLKTNPKTTTKENTSKDYEQAQSLTFDIRKATSIKIPERTDLKVKTTLGNQMQKMVQKTDEPLETVKEGVTKVALKIKDADRGTKYVKALVDSEDKKLGVIDKKIKEKLDGKVSVFSNIGKVFQEADKATKEVTRLETEIKDIHKAAGGATTKDALSLVDGKIDLIKETNKKSKEYISRLEKELELLKAPGLTPTNEIKAFESKLNELKKAYEKSSEASKKLEAEKNSFKKFGKAGAIAGTGAQILTTVMSVKKTSQILSNSNTTFKEGLNAVVDVGVDATKTVGQVSGILDKFKGIPAAKKLSATLAAVGSTYDAVKAWNKTDNPLSKKLDKTAMALLDTTASISSFAADAKHISAGVASKFGKYAAKFAPLEASVASKFGYGIFAVVTVKKAYETLKNPNSTPQEKRSALINAGLDVATGVAMLAGATTVGHVVLGAKIGYELYNFADEKYKISDKVSAVANKAVDAVGQKASELKNDLSQKANEVSKSFGNAKEKASSWVSSFFNKPKLQTA